MAQGGNYSLNIKAFLDEGKIQEQLKYISKTQKIKLEIDGKKVTGEVKKIEDSMGRVVSITSKGSKEFNTITKSIANSEKEVEKLRNRLELSSEQLNKMQVNSQRVFKEYNKGGVDAIQETQKLEKEMKDITAEMQKQIALGDKLSKATVMDLKNRQQLANAQLQTMKASNVATSGGISDMFTKVASFASVTAVISMAVGAVKSMVNEVFVLDTAMTELNKVTNLSKQELSDFKEEAFDIAERLKQTGSAVIDATTEFSRMGYTIEEASTLAEQALIMTNIAEGIDDAGEAAQTITGILKGFGLQASQTNSILDLLNHTSNNNAVSFEALADVLTRSGAALSTANTNIIETSGLATAALEILGADKSETVARALQTMSIRIQANSKDLMDLAGVTTEVDGEFRSMYDILFDLNGQWDALTDSERMAIAEAIAGKQHYGTLSAIMKNFDSAIKVTTEAMDAQGSSMRENEEGMKSLESSLKGLKGAWQDLSDSFMNAEGVAFVLNFLTDFVHGIDSINEKAKNLQKNIGDFFTNMGETLGGLLGLEKTDKEIEQVNNAMENLITNSNAFGEEVDKLNKKLSMNEAIYASLSEEIEGVIEANNILDQTIAKVTKGEALNGDEIIKLINTHPSLQDAIEITNGMYTINAQKLEELREQDYLAAKQTIDSEIAKTKQVIDSTNDRIKAMKTELDDLKTLMTAYSIFSRTAIMARVAGDTSVTDLGASAISKLETDLRGLESASEKAQAQLKSLEIEQLKLDVSYTNSAEKVEGHNSALKENAKSAKRASKENEKLAKELERAQERFEKFKESVHDANKSLNALNNSSIEMVKNLEQLEAGDFSIFKIDQEKTLEELRPLIEKQRKELAKLYGDLEVLKKINTGKLTEAEEKSLNKQLELLRNNIKEQESIHKDYQKNLESIRKQMEKDYEDSIKKEVNATYKSQKDKLEAEKKYQKDRQELIKQQNDALKDLQSETIDMIKQEKNDEIKALEERKDAVEDLADAKRKALKEEQSERNYAKQLKNREKAVSDIEKRIAELQFDTSAKGTKERLELEAQLAQEKEALEDLQYDKSIEKQEEAINEQEKNQKDLLDAQIKAIRDYLSKEGQLRDDANNLIENHSKELYNKLSQYNKEYGDRTQAELDAMYDMAISGLNEWGGSIGSVTNAFDNMSKSIAETVKELERLSQIEISKDLIEEEIRDERPPSSSKPDKESEADSIRSVIKQMMQNSDDWYNADDEEKKQLSKENERLAKKIGAWKSQKDGNWYVEIEGKAYNINNGDALKVRHNGIESGFVGGNAKLKSNEEFNKLMDGELVANPQQMDNFITKTLPKLMDKNSEYTTNNMSPSLILNVGTLDEKTLPEVKQMMNSGIEKLTQHMKGVGFRVNAKSYGI